MFRRLTVTYKAVITHIRPSIVKQDSKCPCDVTGSSMMITWQVAIFIVIIIISCTLISTSKDLSAKNGKQCFIVIVK